MKIQSNEKIETLKNKVKGQIVLPDDPNYGEVRKIWNAMIDGRLSSYSVQKLMTFCLHSLMPVKTG
jgi:hypothetical protein